MGAPNDIRTPYRVGKVIVSNERGLHARAAAKFVKLAATFDADVTVAKNETEVPGGSIMALMMLAATGFVYGPENRLARRHDRYTVVRRPVSP